MDDLVAKGELDLARKHDYSCRHRRFPYMELQPTTSRIILHELHRDL